MNELGTALASSSIQVTLVASTALILERIASRRGPRAGSWVAAASLVIIIVLTPVALCPQPTFLTWRSLGPTEPSSPALPQGSTALVETGPANELIASSSGNTSAVGPASISWRSLTRRLRAGLAWGNDSIRHRHTVLPMSWCVAVIAGTSCCLVRLLLGLLGVRDCRKKSIAIADPDLLAMVATLRTALDVASPIEVRELPDMACPSAAAVGWRRPLVLLPGNWRSWNESERRVVLAHEVAHIARADYVAGVAGRLGLAFHFYHPLVHWIVSRLQLQQELAADAEAARFAGGRRAYLLALSRLALNAHKSRLPWPATTFLPRNGHLIRRIHMLKNQSVAKDGSITLCRRAITIAVLVAMGLVAVGLRSPSPLKAGELPPATEKKTTELAAASHVTAFDVAYIPTKAMGFAAVRPAAIFERAEMKASLAISNAFIAKALPASTLKVEAIEQATVGLYVYPRDRKAGKQGRLMFSGGMVRSVHNFDWRELVRSSVKRFGAPNSELVEIRCEGLVYYKVTHLPAFVFNPCFYFPDARTIVNADEDEIRRLATRGVGDRPEFVSGADWQKVERGLIALAIDNHDDRWRLDRETAEPDDLLVAPLLQNAKRWICGVEGVDSLIVCAIATCGTDEKGQSVSRTAESLFAMLRGAFEKTNVVRADKGKEALFRLARELLQGCKLRRDASVIEVSVECHHTLEDLVTILLADGGV
jgi:beta-lactamase regulating signal transducer with metallopeptidase domain